MMLPALIVFLLVAAYFFFRKKASTAKHATASLVNYPEILQTHISYYQKLNTAEQSRFLLKINGFLNNTRIEGVGTEVTDVDRVMIAASAVIPVFGFPEWRYSNLTNVILYPDTFDGDFQFEGGNRNILGMVGSGYMNGQMLLSRAALVKGFSENSGKENTAIHEFVHLIDKSDGATDGVPENILAHQYAEPWLKMIHQEMRRIEEGKSDIDPYALTNEAEFLAVVSEYFFTKPDQFQHKHPELYKSLMRIFGQNPADVPQIF
ncbi:hypothetical protein BDD43_3893 [Mucilaginibacter gracilis]|uniref:Peptidase n=1 Tax=Mucilaginibacter gracilis TaxID=423350 RepID=A0A495J6N6_9SPHI|nr:M90 family metallopeptidase [Mucilaginibacter gracilis]RKR83679.1 hypothetical protein BDD43_3893 [Mucilaginibacter gracilis]